VFAVVFGIILLLSGASGIFNQLKVTLNRMWGVKEPRRKGVIGFIINRAIAVLMVIIVAGLLLASMLLSTVISSAAGLLSNIMKVPPSFLHFVDLGVSFLLLAMLFALIFKLLPDIRVGWRSVILGAIFTSILFGIGKFGIGFYIAHAGMSSGYGAAGSVVVLLVWVYYSALIFFFGAEFTHVYSESCNLPVEKECVDDEHGSHAKNRPLNAGANI
jgi:membrane protein